MCDYKKVAWYAEQLYGKVKLTYSEDKSILFIITPWDIFKIFMNDKPRFGYYTVYHQNKATEGWHKQKQCNSLTFAVFMCVTHGFYKENNLRIEVGDFDKFKHDAERAWNFEKESDI